jgi:hypothetical protein
MNEAATITTEVHADAIWPITQQEIALLRWLAQRSDHACTSSEANALFQVGWCRLFDYSLIEDRPGVDRQICLTELGLFVAQQCDTTNGSACWLCITVQYPHPEADAEFET